MADIMPFRGVRYDASAVGSDLAAVAAPPYDVISPAEQHELYERHSKNVVRLILGREEDRYKSAAEHFRSWLVDGTLTVDAKPALYIYKQTFADPVTGEMQPTRTGIVCLLKLEDYASGKVLPHENTITSHKADRLNLLRNTQAQFESIQGLYSDPDRAVERFLSTYDGVQPEIESVADMIGSSHTIARIDDLGAVAVLQDLMREKTVFIADGHHRYETSLNYRREIQASTDAPEAVKASADYILITLTAFEDPGLLVLPTHRMVGNLDQSLIDTLPEKLAPLFTVEPIERAAVEQAIIDSAKSGKKAFGIVLPGNRTYLAVLTVDAVDTPALVDGPGSDALKQLDVTLLQRLILQDRLGITPEALAAHANVTYTRDTREAIDAVETGDVQVSFILGRPSVDDVRLVSLAGDKMPQKSTFFYPKLLSGLLLRDLRN